MHDNNRLTTQPNGTITWPIQLQKAYGNGYAEHINTFVDLYEMYETLCVTDERNYYLDGVQIIKDFIPLLTKHAQYYSGTRRKPCGCGNRYGFILITWDHSEWDKIGPIPSESLHCKNCNFLS